LKGTRASSKVLTRNPLVSKDGSVGWQREAFIYYYYYYYYYYIFLFLKMENYILALIDLEASHLDPFIL
jgi:hypothetical protein